MQPVISLQRDGLVHRPGFCRGLIAAALNDEARNDAIEDCPVVMPFLHIAQEILDRNGRMRAVELHGDVAQRGLDQNLIGGRSTDIGLRLRGTQQA